MMNKKGFTTKDFLIAGILFSGIIALMVLAVADFQGNYPDKGPIIDPEFSANYDKLSEQLESIDTIRQTATSGEGLTFRGTFDVTFGSFFTLMALTLDTLDLLGTMYLNIPEDFEFIDRGPLSLLFIIGLSIITVIILLLLINAVGRNKV